MTSKKDAVTGISSFNNAETIASCRLWRRKVVTNAAAASFRSSGSLTAACSAIRRRAIQLNRQLGLRMDIKNPKSSKTPATSDEFAVIHELIRLVGNVTFFDVLCRLTVKDADVVQSLGTLLEYSDLKLDIAGSIVRLFGNLCESKESAASVLQTNPCVRMIVHWLTKNLDDDLARDLAEAPNVSRRDKNDDSAADCAQYEKLREQCVRTLRNAASCGKNFAQYLIRYEAVYAVGRCLRLFESKHGSKNIRVSLVVSAFQFLQLLLPFKDHNYSQQLLRADVLEKLMDSARLDFGESDNSDAAAKLILGMVTHYSSLRCDLSKLGAIEWMKGRIQKLMGTENWSEEVSKGESSTDGEVLIALIRFCRDAYTRAKLRETRALDLLLNIFIGDASKDTKLFSELMSAFLCFLYDDQGLKYLVEYDGFLVSVIRIVDRFSTDFPCSATHFSLSDEEEGDEEASTTAAAVDVALCEFRADSPSYKRFRSDPMAASGDGEMNSFDGPLCKDFSSAALQSSCWSSPSSSPLRNASSPSSPGPAWSPSASSLNSFSSVGSTSPPFAGGKSGSSSCLSPTSDGYRTTDDLEYDWLETDYSRRHSSCSQDQSPPALCGCDPPSAEDPSTYKDRERLLWAAVKLVSWLSHSVHASLLVNGDYLSTFLVYIASVCRPEPRIGRLVERLTRNRLFTESLLAMDFHQKVYDALCVSKCGNGNETKKKCCRCRKVCKIGCAILKSFRAQVDTDFGFGTLKHMMAIGDENTKVHCLCAMLYLMKSNWRVRHFMSGDQGGLSVLLNALSSTETSGDVPKMVVKAFYAGMDKDALHDRLKWSSSTLVAQPSECVFKACGAVTDENLVTFLESGGDGTIDCNMETLVTLSPFYRAMFSGSYSESSRRRFVFDDGGVNSNFSSFVFYLHFLHGCRNCDRATLNSAVECLSVLELADKRLCYSLGEFVVKHMAAKFLRVDNVGHFISNSILRRDLVLYKFCLDFLFAFCNADDFLNVLTGFRTSALGVEFFLMLCNYLKAEYKFE